MWSYLHYTYSAAPAEGYSQTSCSDSDQLEPSSATATAGECYSTDKLTAAYLDSLFGMTSAPSGRTTLQPETISTDSDKSVTDFASVADSPVRILARRDEKPELQAHALGCGKNMPELLARLDPLTRTWRTPPTLLGEGLMLSVQSYPAWGITWRGALYPLRAWERDTFDADFGGLQCEMMPTPLVNAIKSTPSPGRINRHSLDLTCYCNLYPTACVNGLRTGSQVVSRVKSLKHLTDAEKTELLKGKGGKLNPDWVEWLMGWKIGWTKLQPGDFGTLKSTDYPDSQSNATTGDNG